MVLADAVVIKGSPATALFEALESLLPRRDAGGQERGLAD